MNRTLVCTLFSILVTVALVPAAAADEPAYRPGRRPLAGFAKAFMDIPLDALKGEQLVNEEFSRPGMTAGDHSEAAKAGEAFYEAFRDRFEKIYADADQILASPPGGFSPEKLEQVSLDNPALDLKFCRSLARCFSLVALHHFDRKDYDRAIKTLLLADWFSHSIARGAGEVPTLIDLMIAIALRKMACGGILWSSLACASFPPERWTQLEKELSGLEGSQPAFVDSLEWEMVGTTNATRHGLLKGTASEEMVALAKNLPTENREKIVNQAMAYLSDIREKILNQATVYRSNPGKLREVSRAFIEGLQQEGGQARMSDYLDVGHKIGQILAAIMLPNFAKAYDQYLTARYLEKGTILLVRFLAGRRPGDPLPASSAQFEATAKTNLPRDLFAQPAAPCRFSIDDSLMKIYSVGPDQKDDHGEAKDDLILFQVPVKFLKQGN